MNGSECYNLAMKKFGTILAVILGLGVLAAGTIAAIPPLRESALFELNSLRTNVQYAVHPPQEAVFVPEVELATIVQATMQSLDPTATPTPLPSPTLETPGPTQAPTPTATPLPSAVTLSGIRYIDQHGLWNYCAPATLAMALTYWGWEGDRTDVGQVVKPFDKDKNVMPYELADYVNTHTQFQAIVRTGGDLNVLKRLVAEEFIVVVEKGIVIKDYNGRLGWVGHYAVVSGYDDAKQEFMTQDAYFSADYPVSYTDLMNQWRNFNYTFIVIYPPALEDNALQALAEYADETNSYHIAAQTAANEIIALDGVQQFFAYFNRGTSLVNLQDYAGAATAYDQAFLLMAALPEEERPWRIMWYQTGPYFAYYYTGRYADVISLADNTIFYASEPYIEESFIWRARALIMLGDYGAAEEDVRRSLELHPGFTPALDLAAQLGIQP